jgi:hypothetical protein
MLLELLLELIASFSNSHVFLGFFWIRFKFSVKLRFFALTNESVKNVAIYFVLVYIFSCREFNSQHVDSIFIIP